MQNIVINTDSKKFVKSVSNYTTDAGESERPKLDQTDIDILGLSLVNNIGSAFKLNETDTLELSFDADFNHVYDSGVTTAILTGPVTEIQISGLSKTPPETGAILLNESAVRIDYSAATASGDNWIFTVDHDFGATSFPAGTAADIEDGLMVYSDNSMFDVSGDWTEISRADGKTSVRINTRTSPFNAKIQAAVDNDRSRVKVHCQLKRYKAGDSDGDTLLSDYGYAYPAVRLSEGAPAPATPGYLNETEINALFAACTKTDNFAAGKITLPAGVSTAVVLGAVADYPGFKVVGTLRTTNASAQVETMMLEFFAWNDGGTVASMDSPTTSRSEITGFDSDDNLSPSIAGGVQSITFDMASVTNDTTFSYNIIKNKETE